MCSTERQAVDARWLADSRALISAVEIEASNFFASFIGSLPESNSSKRAIRVFRLKWTEGFTFFVNIIYCIFMSSYKEIKFSKINYFLITVLRMRARVCYMICKTSLESNKDVNN